MPMTIASLAALAVLTTSSGTVTDTTVAAEPGSRLEVNTFSGEIVVDVWNRNAIRVRAEHNSRTRVTVDASEPTIVVRARDGTGRFCAPSRREDDPRGAAQGRRVHRDVPR